VGVARCSATILDLVEVFPHGLRVDIGLVEAPVRRRRARPDQQPALGMESRGKGPRVRSGHGVTTHGKRAPPHPSNATCSTEVGGLLCVPADELKWCLREHCMCEPYRGRVEVRVVVGEPEVDTDGAGVRVGVDAALVPRVVVLVSPRLATCAQNRKCKHTRAHKSAGATTTASNSNDDEPSQKALIDLKSSYYTRNIVRQASTRARTHYTCTSCRAPRMAGRATRSSAATCDGWGGY